MSYTVFDFEQGSDQWFDARMGMITASKFKDVMAKGQGKTRKSYMYQLAGEMITGEREDSYSNSYMEWGTLNEPSARAMYELEKGVEVDLVGLITTDGKNVAASPDGLVGNDGSIEIKCPKTTTQIETYLSGKMPTGHKAQVQGQMWVAERDWVDFISFDPRMNGAASFFCTRVYRDEDYIKTLEESCKIFESELYYMVELLQGE